MFKQLAPKIALLLAVFSCFAIATCENTPALYIRATGTRSIEVFNYSGQPLVLPNQARLIGVRSEGDLRFRLFDTHGSTLSICAAIDYVDTPKYVEIADGKSMTYAPAFDAFRHGYCLSREQVFFMQAYYAIPNKNSSQQIFSNCIRVDKHNNTRQGKCPVGANSKEGEKRDGV